jgi:hypothetical protein
MQAFELVIEWATTLEQLDQLGLQLLDLYLYLVKWATTIKLGCNFGSFVELFGSIPSVLYVYFTVQMFLIPKIFY